MAVLIFRFDHTSIARIGTGKHERQILYILTLKCQRLIFVKSPLAQATSSSLIPSAFAASHQGK